MTTIEKIEKGIITLAEFTDDQQSFIRGIVKLSFNEGQEQALLKEFHNELSKHFDYDNFDVVSPNLLGSLNSMLNGEFNAVLVKHLTREQREKVSLNDLLDIFKNNPNSDYDCQLPTV